MINLVIMTKCLTSMYAVSSYTARGNFLKGIIPVNARRALEKEKIDCLEKLSEYSEEEIMQLQGFGKSTMEKLRAHLKENHLSFRESIPDSL